MTADPALMELSATLADWTHPHTSIKIYIFGSRVRGDHRPDSDVDIIVCHTDYSDEPTTWWLKENEDEFRSINNKLPGPLHILNDDDPISAKVLSAGLGSVYKDRNVSCVWLPPWEPTKPGQT